MSKNPFLVSVSIGTAKKTVLWDQAAPLPLGSPMRYVLERGPAGPRLRDLTAGGRGPESVRQREFTPEMIARGAAVDAGGLSVTLRPVHPIRAAFAEPASAAGELRALVCQGGWIQRTETLGDVMQGHVDGQLAFIVRRISPFSYRISITDPATTWVMGGRAETDLRLDELARVRIVHGARSWVFTRVDVAALPEPERLPSNGEDTLYRRTLAAGSALIAVVALVQGLFYAPPAKEELVPAQFTKVVMSQHKRMKSSAASSSRAHSAPLVRNAGSAPVKRAAVAQAFRSDELRKSMRGLLKGGMNRLIERSEFVNGSDSAEHARRIFDTPSEALRATAPAGGSISLGDGPVKVAALGGGGESGTAHGGKAGVGYGKGQHAGVAGQGKSFVSMDNGGANVDDGLSRDEVGEVIHRHLSEVRYCYEAAMLRTPEVEGKLTLNFTISAPGSVRSASVKHSTLADSGIDECVLKRLLTWRFPQPKGGIEVAVNYPFIFKTIGR